MRLYDTLTATVSELDPVEPGRFGMYVCGPTVQDEPHFGHARAAIVPDALRRYLEWRGLDVCMVKNITDVDDKIIERAAREGRMAGEVADFFERRFDEQMTRLGVLPAHINPRATGHITEMVELVERLVDVGAAYETGGDVWFRVRSFPAYGALSGRDVDELRAGARVEADERKEDPLDFALWKAAKPGEPSWPSPWSRGRPGWHVECSAMAGAYLGTDFDLHAGGADLIFPHHENEIAQSESATKANFARRWLHNGMLSIQGEKMSKSLGNVVSLAQAIDEHGAAAVRFFFLSAHYRSPLEVGPDHLADAAAGLDRLRGLVRATMGVDVEPVASEAVTAQRQAFIAAMSDDLSTPVAHAALFELVRLGHAALEGGDDATAAAARDTVVELAGVLGYDLTAQGSVGDAELVGGLIEALLELRARARAVGDFATADDIRARLSQLGVAVEDRPNGPRWRLS
ncbi:MAG: cysteine--tRNA ligase [Actinobacteria bacterium QS_5_72_10]|nr:MAG: cysteine--tRNA ligase [Actinobacteria bacterium QS_5_72_10]